MAKNVTETVARAKAECDKAGVKLTVKRQNILAVLLQSSAPLSAYEIVDHYREEFGESLPAMSVYRILEFLVANRLVHRLATTNQFLACSHITCDHRHEVPQFLICDQCHSVEEVGLRLTLVKELQDSVEKTGFLMGNQQLELHGVCAACQAK